MGKGNENTASLKKEAVGCGTTPRSWFSFIKTGFFLGFFQGCLTINGFCSKMLG